MTFIFVLVHRDEAKYKGKYTPTIKFNVYIYEDYATMGCTVCLKIIMQHIWAIFNTNTHQHTPAKKSALEIDKGKISIIISSTHYHFSF